MSLQSTLLAHLRHCTLVVACALSSCTASIPSRQTSSQTVSTFAIAQTVPSSLQRMLAPAIAAHPGRSGFRVLEYGRDSLYVRLQLIRAAERTLDLQYYAVSNDVTSKLIAAALINAGRRGVRVRLLIDGFTVGSMAASLAALDAEPNIEIKVFNPISFQGATAFGRAVSTIGRLPLLNRRMHNKALVADNQLAIIGGRNLGDEYFEGEGGLQFEDVDVLMAGHVTAEVSESFDDYWNAPSSVLLNAVHSPAADSRKLVAARRQLRDNWQREFGDPAPAGTDPVEWRLMADPKLEMLWAPGRVLADAPEKITTPRAQTRSPIVAELRRLTAAAQNSFTALAAYFVPLDEGVAWLTDLADRGVNVTILTNSLASTDVVKVHAGYQKYRVPLLKQGVHLYEFKSEAPQPKRPLGRTAPAQAALHAKLYMVDGRYTLIGSFNLDPRSAELNTEIAVVIDSPELTRRLQHDAAKIIGPDTSYRLFFDKEQGVRWHGREGNANWVHTCTPDAIIGRRMQNFFWSLLPLDKQL